MSVEEQFNREKAYVAAGQADQQISSRKGGIIQRIIIVPATTAPGAVSYKDGSGDSARTVYTGGTVGTGLEPIVVEMGIRGAGTDGFYITTGANLSVIVVGRFNTI
jgi:hypothetical protein